MLFDIFYRKTENNLTRENVVFTQIFIAIFSFIVCVCVENFL